MTHNKILRKSRGGWSGKGNGATHPKVSRAVGASVADLARSNVFELLEGELEHEVSVADRETRVDHAVRNLAFAAEAFRCLDGDERRLVNDVHLSHRCRCRPGDARGLLDPRGALGIVHDTKRLEHRALAHVRSVSGGRSGLRSLGGGLLEGSGARPRGDRAEVPQDESRESRQKWNENTTALHGKLLLPRPAGGEVELIKAPGTDPKIAYV